MTDLEPESSAAPHDNFFDRHILPYMSEQTLWPVLIVLVLHAAAFGAMVLIFSLRERRISAIATLLLLGWLSVQGMFWERKTRHGLGALTGLVASTWAITVGLAWAAVHYGVF